MLRNYLNKNHNYRVKNFTVRPRAIIDDNFGTFYGEAFGSNGWRLCTTVGKDSIAELDYFTTLSNEQFQWSYGCGGGSYTSCGGVGSTTDFVNDSIQTIFSMLFGSYFGDWDSQDNFMRSALASGTALTCSWAGRPHWHYHHMALGENIGYSAYITQNNTSTYVYNYAARYIHIALMGDPTLRMHIVAPPSNLVAAASGLNNVTLTWTASADSVLGYYVYRADSNGVYQRITPSIINVTNYLDTSPAIFNNRYMVRAIKLEESVSGTYYNLSTGIADSVLLANGLNENNVQAHLIKLFPNPSKDFIELKFSETNSNNAEAIIYNMHGQPLKYLTFNLSRGMHYKVNIDDLVSGIYVIRINIENVSEFLKIVIEK